ncbi:MAG: MGMT family protein [Nitriliruptoraceae bacterium]
MTGEADRSQLARDVLAVVAATRPGEVLTYGEVAVEAGAPGAARAVGRVLAEHGRAVPWWRVVASSGRLVPGAEEEHAERLRAEGVSCSKGRVAASALRPPTAR